MENVLLIIVVAVAVIAIAAAAWFYYQLQNSRRLKQRFGPEYDRTVERLSDREAAERELNEREKRVTRFNIVSLSAQDCERYQSKWTQVQAQFVDEPKTAVSEADFLIQEVMRKRGYPVSDFEQAAADLSVEHPVVVENYRVAYAIAERNQRGAADTEELRRAFVSYRTLFEELLRTNPPPREESKPRVVKPAFGKSQNRKGMQA